MMNRIYIPIVFSALFIFLSACDKIETPLEKGGDEAIMDTVIANDISQSYKELENMAWDTVKSPSNRNVQFILLEEFTGHTCPNCPMGTKELLRLDSIYGNQLVPISIHAGGFAVPQSNPDGSFATDHRLPEILEGNYLAKLEVPAFPTGLVQRNDKVLPYSKWEVEVTDIGNQSPKAALQITNLYNAQERIIRTIVNYEWFESLSENYNIQVFVKEDHIVDWQININYNEPNYHHRHVLQKVVNKIFGVPAEAALAGGKGRKEYIFKADADWNIQNTSVVAFLYKANSPYNVVQVNEAKVLD